MARNVLKSNNSIMLITEAPAFSTNDKDGFLYRGVVNSSFEFQVDRQSARQIGSQNLSYNDPNRHPDVSFSNEYIFSALLLNERFLGFNVDDTSPYAFDSFTNKSYNFCYLHHPDQQSDALDEYYAISPNFSGYEAVSIGNAYLNRYSVNYAIGQLPTVSTSFQASNIKYELLTGNDIESPAINLSSGNNNQVGNINFTGFSDYFDVADYPIYAHDVDVNLQNIQVGGQVLSGYHFIQSLSMDLSLDRTPLYGLGSNYVYDRKLQYPINGSVSIQSLVSGFDSGVASGLLNNESGYNFEINFVDKNQSYSGKFIIEDAKLNSYSYSMAVNQAMNFNAEFSFEVSENYGLRISGYDVSDWDDYNWSQSPEIWNLANQFWIKA